MLYRPVPAAVCRSAAWCIRTKPVPLVIFPDRAEKYLSTVMFEPFADK